jgi:hypothetical protein
VTVGGWEVYYGNQGVLDAEPYLRLADDVTSPGGREVVQVSRWLPLLYHVDVVNFSREPTLNAASPVVELTVGGRAHAFTCPSSHSSDRWAVCAIDGRSGVVTSG